jgi:hypothetical protein
VIRPAGDPAAGAGRLAADCFDYLAAAGTFLTAELNWLTAAFTFDERDPIDGSSSARLGSWRWPKFQCGVSISRILIRRQVAEPVQPPS